MPTLCGCYHTVDTSASADDLSNGPDNLPLLSSNAHATILSTTTRTKLRQTFCNPSPTNLIKECAYVFPVYDGVSVVGFTCHVGSCTIHGIVKEKNTAKAVYDDAVARGETAGLLAQEWDASDVFSAKIGSIPANETVTVEITYIGELEHDIGSDAIRYSLPTKIMPRYGSKPTTSDTVGSLVPSSIRKGGIQITVDVNMADGAHIEEIKSTTYDAIEISFPTPLTALDVPHTVHEASVKLSIDKASLEKDFILLVKTKDPTVPKAILESHPTIQGQRALIVTLVPRFTLPTPSSEDLPTTPSEIIFVVDRSGSMENWMPTLISAMKVSLKSLKEGVRFNICSFGTNHSFLWSESRPKVRDTLKEALIHVESFRADMYGTEMHSAIEATFRKLTGDHPCEIMLFTDGECWDSDSLCKYISHEVGVSKGNIRLFSLGIGKSVSSALIHGVARAGNGFAQNVDTEANMDTKVIRMLKGAMSPHVTDYSLQVKYAEDCGDEFELVNSCTRSIEFEAWEPINSEEVKTQKNNTPSIPIFDKNVHPDNEEFATASERDSKDRPGVSLKLPPPELLQAPSNIPPLFSFLRTTVYVLMSPQTSHKNPTSIVLKGSLKGQSLEQEIPIEILPEAGETLHQLAAKKAIQELEQGRGWIYDAKHKFEEFLEGSLKDQTSSRFEQKVEEEAVRLGVLFQVAGKWCSFVAVSSNDDNQETGEFTEKDTIINLDCDGWLIAPLRIQLLMIQACSMTYPFAN